MGISNGSVSRSSGILDVGSDIMNGKHGMIDKAANYTSVHHKQFTTPYYNPLTVQLIRLDWVDQNQTAEQDENHRPSCRDINECGIISAQAI